MKLITFGDSWVWGVGAGWKKDQTKEEYSSVAWSPESEQQSFRSLLSNKFNLENVNHSRPGSSNQSQVRRASEYFIRDREDQKDIFVIWGLTSVYRFEVYDVDINGFETQFIPGRTKFSEMLATNFFDEGVETSNLYYQIKLFNAYFNQLGIKNYWFNIFNEHKFPKKVDNLLFNGTSLLSMLTNDNKPNDSYHKSDWLFEKELNTDRKIKKARDKSMVNPYSSHPTDKSHQRIAEMFEQEIDFTTGDRR